MTRLKTKLYLAYSSDLTFGQKLYIYTRTEREQLYCYCILHFVCISETNMNFIVFSGYTDGQGTDKMVTAKIMVDIKHLLTQTFHQTHINALCISNGPISGQRI